MSIITKNGSDNASCATGLGGCSGGTPQATPEPKATMSTSRADLHYPSFQNPSRLCQLQEARSSKIVRIFTVLAYMVAVSTAAILLSIYYTFIWNPYELPAQNGSGNGNFTSGQFTRDQSADYSKQPNFVPMPHSVNATSRVNLSRSAEQLDEDSFALPDHGTSTSTRSLYQRTPPSDHVARLVLSNRIVTNNESAEEPDSDDQMMTSTGEQQSTSANFTVATSLATPEPNLTSATEMHG